METVFDIPTLLKVRKTTRRVASVLTDELSAHLSTLGPLINPRSILGEHLRGGPKVSAAICDAALAEVKEHYGQLYKTKPFSLRSEFEQPITLMSTTPELTPIAYQHTAKSESEEKQITVTSTTKWALSLQGYGITQLAELLERQGEQDSAAIQELVLHQLCLTATLNQRKGVQDLLTALRFSVHMETLDAFGSLPLPIIHAPLKSLLPPDKVMIESTEISGSSQFEEIIDPDDISTLVDPLKDKLAGETADV